jgi:hypothetical protein
MAKIHLVIPALTLHGTTVHSERDGISLAERNYLDSRLHPRPLLGEYEFAACEVANWI